MSGWDDSILTGEGVALSAGAAPVTLRVASGLIDILAYAGATWAAMFVTFSLIRTDSGAWVAALSISLVVGGLVVVPATVETLSRGRSPGRWALGLRIVRDDAGPISFRHSLGRALIGLIETFGTFGMLAATVSLINSRGKRLGDVLMGTYAMRVRGGRSTMASLVMPPWLDTWASQADMRGLPDGLALTSRMFLARAASMHDAARARIGTELAQALRQYVAPPPPEGTHPESFIAAVLVSRRDREYAYESRRAVRAEEDMRRLSSLPFDLADADN